MRDSATTLQSECTEAERAALQDVLLQAGYTGAHLEIGTAAGGTLKELMGVYPDADSRPTFFVIDPMTYFPDQMTKVRQNLSSAGIAPDSVTFHVGTTRSFLPIAKSHKLRFDFVFIDGDHRQLPVLLDLQMADFVTVGGTIALHDDNDRFPGVGWAISRFLDRNPGFTHLGTTESLTLLRKMAPSAHNAVTPGDLLMARIAQTWASWKRSWRKRTRRG
jgi:predicted O-methyltransferase YrrM